MKNGDYIFIVKKDVLIGDKRPSLARVLHIDEEGSKALIESTYRHVNTNMPEHAKWVVPLGSCIPISKEALDIAASSKAKEIDIYDNDLVSWVDKDGLVSNGIVINSTPKTVEILRSGSIKDLIVKL